jgi:hypothetical protein
MPIERDPEIRFHEQGTLNAVTRWITSHDEGLAEWLKNVRRAYQVDRADVEPEHRAALLLLKDEDDAGSARIGLLDVGGAQLEDVTAWSTWQAKTVLSRVQGVEDTLLSARALLESRHLEEVGDKQGRLLFERQDVDRALDFQAAMKERFSKELHVLTGGKPS